jgi:large subunit ribosomal protein L24
MARIRKDDDVVVITGKEKGKRGKVLRVLPSSERVVVAGVNVRTRHVKPTQANPQGGRVQKEFPIHVSNVMLADPRSGEPTRIRMKTLENGRRVRVAVKSGEQVDG